MILPSPVFGFIIAAALGLTTIAPVLLIVLLARDWKQGKLW